MSTSNKNPFISALRKVKRRFNEPFYSKFPHNPGYCLICENNVDFFEENTWLRDFYKCSGCRSIPRNRALINVLNKFVPDWRSLQIHESSPGGQLSDFLRQKAPGYAASYYYDDVPRGEYKDGFRSEDLSNLTLSEDSVDIFVTSDVFEHIMEPSKAFAEIARVLKPGGAHVFTMPWYPNLARSVQRAKFVDGKVEHTLEAIYHGNPISEQGSLVTYDWGRDFCDFIYETSGLTTTIYLEKNRSLGLEAEFLEVFISAKHDRHKQ